MHDTAFTAMLKTGKLTARAEETKTIRRVQFSLVRDFTVADAEWLGTEAIQLRSALKNRTLNRFEIPIDAYHAKASFHGRGGNVDVDVDGITATAAVVGSEENEHEEVSYLFEAFPDAKLLTFLASSLKEHIDCELKRTQVQMHFGVVDKDKKSKAGEKDKSKQMSLADKGKTGEKDTAPKNETAAKGKLAAGTAKKTAAKGDGLTYKIGDKVDAGRKPTGVVP